MTLRTSKSRGFSLIEVMIAVLVLAIGILAVSKLQTSLLRSGSDANKRSIAANIAQKKIDDLRRFVEISTLDDWNDLTVNSVTSLKYPLSLAFNNIADNEGGRIQPGPINSGNDVFNLSWTTDNYYYNGVNQIATTNAVAPDVAFKLAHVVVSWDGVGDDTNNVVSFDTFIHAYDLSHTSLGGSPSSVGTPGPVAKYNPLGAPDVINIDVDTGKLRQTSKPLPDVVSDENTLVQFEVVTYHQDGNDFIADRKEEFITASCNCELTSSDLGYKPGYVLWDGVNRDDELDPVMINKATATATNNDSDAENICTVCCRDHHDATASPIKYVAGTTTGDHPHYKADGSIATVGEEYVESCRLKRIDGVFRAFQDWNLKDITVMDRASLADGNQLQTDYVNYQKDFILNNVASVGGTPTKPALRSPVSMTLGAQQQLEARGVYIDNVYDVGGNPNPASYLTYVQSASKTDRLEIIPFAEVNLTLLAAWASDTPTNVTVTNEDADTVVDPVNDYYGTFSRGWASALNQATPGADITTTMRDDNHGLTQVVATSPSPNNLDDTLTVNVGASAGAITVSGTYEITYPLGNTGSPTISPAGDCNLLGNPSIYTCSFNSPWTGTIQIAVNITTGQKTKRCSGSSVAFGASGLTTNTTHNFASFACDQPPL
ncbi:MAG: hypothetical protein AXW15_12225 [Neptuniibacter sp. Phe_28]|nr:MAG: hypothetical protein AXW15_12225 [Neptuniibacter sp. Phe_28]